MFTQFISAIGTAFVSYAMLRSYLPPELFSFFRGYINIFISYFNPSISIHFREYTGDGFQRSKVFVSIERYLNGAAISQATSLQSSSEQDTESVILVLANHQQVTDTFQGINIRWSSWVNTSNNPTISWYPMEESKHYTLKVHKKHREIITTKYIPHVIKQGKEIAVKERRRKLFTNTVKDDHYRFRDKSPAWGHIPFKHPSTFDTLGMESKQKKEIMEDLINFSKSESYYAKVGKAWKRGYLLYGPPVRDNTELRKLLINTTPKSILVIEDIDCSLDLTGERMKKEKAKKQKEKDPIGEILKPGQDDRSKVTLSGLLNMIDGLWSACGGERIIVFTTNHIEKLDAALIRRGRMDKHIELSYCRYEAFRTLASKYLGIESSREHEMFPGIKVLLEETEMTPADVAENLMPNYIGEDVDSRLVRLIEALEDNKRKAADEKKKKEEEDMKKNEKDEDESVVVENGDKKV